jgi:hypothetical protein
MKCAQKAKKPINEQRALYACNVRFADAAKRIRSRIMSNLLAKYPTGEYFDDYIYKKWYAHLIPMCTEIIEYRHFKSDGMPKFYFASRSRQHNMAIDLYRNFITWVGGGLIGEHKHRCEAGHIWEDQSSPGTLRWIEIDVIEELVWMYCSEVDTNYLNSGYDIAD